MLRYGAPPAGFEQYESSDRVQRQGRDMRYTSAALGMDLILDPNQCFVRDSSHHDNANDRA